MISHIHIIVFDRMAALDMTLRVSPVPEAAKVRRSILVQVYCAKSEPTHSHACNCKRLPRLGINRSGELRRVAR